MQDELKNEKIIFILLFKFFYIYKKRIAPFLKYKSLEFHSHIYCTTIYVYIIKKDIDIIR